MIEFVPRRVQRGARARKVDRAKRSAIVSEQTWRVDQLVAEPQPVAIVGEFAFGERIQSSAPKCLPLVGIEFKFKTPGSVVTATPESLVESELRPRTRGREAGGKNARIERDVGTLLGDGAGVDLHRT